MSLVEDTLRFQREAWREVSSRVSQLGVRDFPHERPKRILLFGLGSSHFAARLTGYALIRDKSRVRTPVIACSSMAIGQEVIPVKGDWAIAFSHRGGSLPTTQAVELCEQAGAFTVLVCGQKAATMPGTQYVLETVPQEKVEPHTMSVTGAICAATTLLIGAKALEEWDALTSIGDPDLEQMRNRAGEGAHVLLGEWEGEWLAREGALKLMEMARVPARVFGSEEFFHGPRVSVRPEEKIWHIRMPRDKRSPEIHAAHTVDIFGATPLAWMPALVELQWLSLATALNLGIDPDRAAG